MSITSTYGSWTVSWPWPRALFCENYILGFAKESNNLYGFEMHVNDGNWSATAVVDLGLEANIDQLNVLDFGPYYVISTMEVEDDGTLNVATYERDVSAAPSLSCMSAFVDPAYGVGCNFNGQAVVGAIDGSGAEDGWKWVGQHMGGNTVVWGRIGQMSFDVEASPTAGFANMSWKSYDGQSEGVVLSIRKLGEAVIVLGDGGGAALLPREEPQVTFGVKPLPLSGVASGDHVAGDENILVFIDQNYELWKADDSLKFEKLGYKEWFEDLLGTSTTIVSYVPEKKRFYFSNGTDCYVLTEYGLYTCNQAVTSVGVTRDGSLYGFFVDNADYEWRIETGSLDFGQRSMKTLQVLEMHGHYEKTSGVVSAKFKYKNEYTSDDFTALDWVELNPWGIVTIPLTASEFRVSLKGTDYRSSSCMVEAMKARVKLSDKRSIRGTYKKKSEYVDKTLA